MEKTMSPSETETMSRGQITKIYELLEHGLLKTGLPKGQSQEVIESQGANMVKAFIADFRKRVEALMEMIFRIVHADVSLTAQATLDATGRTQYTDREVVNSMPRGKDEPTTVYIFKPRPEAYDRDGYLTNAKLAEEYEFNGLTPVDPFSLAKIHIDDPAFSDDRPVGTHWKNADGKWCCAAFDRWVGERGVGVGLAGGGWHGSWSFGGVRE